MENIKKKLSRFSIPHLMELLIGGMTVVYLASYMFPELNLTYWMRLSWALVMQGQVWRLVTFVFLPPQTSMLFVLFALYFYWMIGTGLSSQWGQAKFTRFYLTGVVGTWLAALITGGADNTWLNLSLFLAFASVFPNFEVMLFFFLPVKVKYLALLDVALYAYQMIVGTWSIRAAILAALVNVILFLGGDLMRNLKNDSQYWKTRANFRRAMKR